MKKFVTGFVLSAVIATLAYASEILHGHAEVTLPARGCSDATKQLATDLAKELAQQDAQSQCPFYMTATPVNNHISHVLTCTADDLDPDNSGYKLKVVASGTFTCE